MYVAANGNMMSSYLMKYAFRASDEGSTDAKSTGTESPSSAVCIQFAPSGPSPMPLTLNYKRIVTPKRVTLGAELSCDPVTLQSHCVLGAEFKFNR